MREIEVGELTVSVDSDGYVQSVIEDEEEIIDTLSHSEISDLKGLAKQQAQEDYDEDRTVPEWQDYNGC
jgi:sulfur relay (sulfurtransferase) DsrC/TusE family protein